MFQHAAHQGFCYHITFRKIMLNNLFIWAWVMVMHRKRIDDGLKETSYWSRQVVTWIEGNDILSVIVCQSYNIVIAARRQTVAHYISRVGYRAAEGELKVPNSLTSDNSNGICPRQYPKGYWRTISLWAQCAFSIYGITMSRKSSTASETTEQPEALKSSEITPPPYEEANAGHLTHGKR